MKASGWPVPRAAGFASSALRDGAGGVARGSLDHAVSMGRGARLSSSGPAGGGGGNSHGKRRWLVEPAAVWRTVRISSTGKMMTHGICIYYIRYISYADTVRSRSCAHTHPQHQEDPTATREGGRRSHFIGIFEHDEVIAVHLRGDEYKLAERAYTHAQDRRPAVCPFHAHPVRARREGTDVLADAGTTGNFQQ